MLGIGALSELPLNTQAGSNYYLQFSSTRNISVTPKNRNVAVPEKDRNISVTPKNRNVAVPEKDRTIRT